MEYINFIKEKTKLPGEKYPVVDGSAPIGTNKGLANFKM
jgi:hypothetical protein